MGAKRTIRKSPQRLGLALVATGLVVGLGLSLPATSVSGHRGQDAIRSLTPAQKKAKAREMAKCRKIKSTTKRNQCIKKVNKRFGSKPGKTWQVGVLDNYYRPAILKLKVNDSINWIWEELNGREAHDVGLQSGPKKVDPYDFLSPTTAVFGTKFRRQFKVPGDYSFICSLHYQMTMQVKVTR